MFLLWKRPYSKTSPNQFILDKRCSLVVIGEGRTSLPQTILPLTDVTHRKEVTSAAPPGGTNTKGESSGTDRFTIKTTANERLTTDVNERLTTDNVQSFIHTSTTESRPAVDNALEPTQLTGEPLTSLDPTQMTITFTQQSQNHTPLKGSSSVIDSRPLSYPPYLTFLSSTSKTVEPFRKSSVPYVSLATVTKPLRLSSSQSSSSSSSSSSSLSSSSSSSSISPSPHTSTPSKLHTHLSTALSATSNTLIVLSSISSLTSSSLSSTSSSLSSISSFEQPQSVPTKEPPWSLSYPEIIGSSLGNLDQLESKQKILKKNVLIAIGLYLQQKLFIVNHLFRNM